MTLNKISEILGGKKVLGQDIETSMDLVELGQRGITKEAVLHLAKYMAWPQAEVEKILPISNRTLQRYTPKRHLAPQVSEQALHIAELITRGEEVFHNKNKFMEWLKRPNFALGGITPISLLKSRFGIEMIMDILGRIEHGIYS